MRLLLIFSNPSYFHILLHVLPPLIEAHHPHLDIIVDLCLSTTHRRICPLQIMYPAQGQHLYIIILLQRYLVWVTVKGIYLRHRHYRHYPCMHLPPQRQAMVVHPVQDLAHPITVHINLKSPSHPVHLAQEQHHHIPPPANRLSPLHLHQVWVHLRRRRKRDC